MGTINVPRVKIVELLGLSPDVDDATLVAALNKAIAQQQAKNAEKQLEAEDRRIVMAAINDGKIGPNRREFWMGALKSNRADNRSILASLTAVPAALRRTAASANMQNPATVDPGSDGTWVTDEQLNAYIESDEAMHPAIWAMGKGRGGSYGLKEPSPRYFVSAAYENPWDPKPKLVDNPDGTATWQNQEPDLETLGVVQGPRPQNGFNRFRGNPSGRTNPR